VKAERNSDGTYNLTGLSWSGVLDLYGMLYDWVDSVESSGDKLDIGEQMLYDEVGKLRDMVDEDVTY
jgi:hypothetical protein